MDLSLIKDYLRTFEGYKTEVYQDSLGIYTVGIGHQIKGNEKPHIIPRIGFSVLDNQIQIMFHNDIMEAVKTAKNIIPNFNTQPTEIQNFLIMMTFNLGYRLRTFKKANKHLINFNYGLARKEYLNSKWVKQVGERRATITTDLLRFKKWKL